MSRETKIKIFINTIFLIVVLLLTVLLFFIDYSTINMAKIFTMIIVYFGILTIVSISIKDLIEDIKNGEKWWIDY